MRTWPARSAGDNPPRIVSTQPCGVGGTLGTTAEALGLVGALGGGEALGGGGADDRARGAGVSATARRITHPAITISRTTPALSHRTLLVIAAHAIERATGARGPCECYRRRNRLKPAAASTPAITISAAMMIW
jgi:hypothetical protein